MVCGDRDETINYVLSECSKLAQREYKARHDWVEKVIHMELCKKIHFGYTTKRYIHKPESVLENETHNILWDFDLKTNRLIRSQKTRPSID